MTTTPDKILDTAERLFAEHGIAAVSTRAIIAQADVNTAAVHYHFGSKDELIRAVLRRRITQVNEDRMSGLEALREKHGSDPIEVKALLRAFLTPVMQLDDKTSGAGKDFFRLISRAHADTNPAVQEELFELLKDVIGEYLGELARSLPHVSKKELGTRLAFLAGSMIQAVLLPLKPLFIDKFFGGELAADEILDMLVAFCAGGFTAEGIEK